MSVWCIFTSEGNLLPGGKTIYFWKKSNVLSKDMKGDWAETGIKLGSVSNLHWAVALVLGSIALVPFPEHEEIKIFPLVS